MNIEISPKLESQINNYLKITNDKRTFEKFVDDELRFGLNKLIHKTKKTQKQSILCNDPNPKIVRKTFDMTNIFEYFLCEKCNQNDVYSNPTSEESILWLDSPKS